MTRRLTSYVAAVSVFALIVLLSGEIALDSVLRYFTDRQAPPGPILANTFANPFLIAHVAGGVTALVIAPLQLVGRIRERVPALHRATGRIYVGACVVAAPAGFMLALGTTAGPIAGLGFALLAILWPAFTYLGIRSAMDGRLADHRAWMIRSYALAATAITLRLMLPLAGALDLPFLPAYQAIAWISWLTNLALAELCLRRQQRWTRISAKVATA